jgi:hypothetical protein
MRDQIEKLIGECEGSSVRLQVVPLGSGATRGILGFIALHFARDSATGAAPSMPDIVYYDSIISPGYYLERVDDVRQHLDVFAEIEAVALSERDTLAFLKSINQSQS